MRFKEWFVENHIKIHLPAVQQRHDYDCGAAAFRSVCEFFGVGPEDHGEFIKLCNTSHNTGTRPTNLLQAAKKVGLQAKAQKEMTVEELKKYVDKGVPVICPIQAWTEGEDRWKTYNKKGSGHYVVVIGYDEGNIYFEDPVIKGTRGHVPFDEWEKRWKDADAEGEHFNQFGIALWKDGKTHPEPKHKTKFVP